MSTPSLWHNMSSPPRTVISCEPEYSLDTFRHVLLGPVPDVKDASPKELLERLDGAPWKGTARRAESELRTRLNAHARTLPLPAMVLLGDPMGYADEHCGDLLTALAVFSKSGHHVYLRDKEPDLTAFSRMWALMLHVPRATPQIGEEIRRES